MNNVLAYLNEVEEKEIFYHHVKDIKISRGNGHIGEAFTMAKLFLRKVRPELAGGQEKIPPIIFDMNELFEEFVFALLKENQNSLGIKNLAWQKKKRLIAKPTSLMDTKLDIYFETSSGDSIIIDTKYKVLDEDAGALGVKNSDIYQVCTYRQLYNDNSKILLLYPKNEKDIKQRFTLGGTLGELFVATIDLGQDLSLGTEYFVERFEDLSEFIFQ